MVDGGRRVRTPRPNAALKRAITRGDRDRMAALIEDLKESPAEELATAASEYLAFFASCAESPKVNAVRKRIEGLIQQVRGN